MLLISGHQRSGTSLLRHLCHDHPQIAVTHELGVMLSVDQPYRQYCDQILRRWRRKLFRNWIVVPPPWRRVHSRMDILRGHLFTARYLWYLHRHCDGIVRSGLVNETLAHLFPTKNIIGDKENGYVFRLDNLISVPGIKIVIIYRDCRDVTSSFLIQARTSWRGQAWVAGADTAEGAARRWVRAIDAMERYAGQVHVIRYEDLVRQPDQEFAILADWLGVDAAGFHSAAVRDKSVGKYRCGLSDRELDAVIAVAGPTMARLGYR